MVEAAADQAEVLAVKREPAEARPRGRTLYYCPYPDPGTAQPCQFFTSKAGFMNNKAADHLMNVHKLRLQDMKPGQCKFNKVKVETAMKSKEGPTKQMLMSEVEFLDAWKMETMCTQQVMP